VGSFKFWIEYQKTNEPHHPEADEIVTEINITNQETTPDIDDRENNEEVDDYYDDKERNEEPKHLTSKITIPSIVVEEEILETNDSTI
jgi:hypothetical protein